MHPIVDGIQLQYAGRLIVYKLDYNQAADQRIAHAYAVRSHPVILVIDRDGVPVARWSGIVSEAEIAFVLRNLPGNP